jgi:hypothetical protein
MEPRRSMLRRHDFCLILVSLQLAFDLGHTLCTAFSK